MPFEAFWPRYLRAHSDPRTRALHVAGTLIGTTVVKCMDISSCFYAAGFTAV